MPGLPAMASTLFSGPRFATGMPPTDVMTSPFTRPAVAAGLSANTSVMPIPSVRRFTRMPMPV